MTPEAITKERISDLIFKAAVWRQLEIKLEAMEDEQQKHWLIMKQLLREGATRTQLRATISCSEGYLKLLEKMYGPTNPQGLAVVQP